MRLWTLHPRYLDPQGLVALWREALLARRVLRGATRGYRQHPQLTRFRSHDVPSAAINAYLGSVLLEADMRGYSFDHRKIRRLPLTALLPANAGQLDFEWQHLCGKLGSRNPAWLERLGKIGRPECHPLFHVVPGPAEAWERGTATNGLRR
jgi:hypothetical protein